MKKSVFKRILSIGLVFLLLLSLAGAIVWIMVTQPTTITNPRSSVTVNVPRLEEHVRMLSETYSPRDSSHVANLDLCAAYILNHFIRAGALSASLQTFSHAEREYHNVIGSFGLRSHERIVIGAHYDAVAGSPGADDNASGVAGLIELAYILGKSQLPGEVELVAYTLEETGKYGSVYHAQSLVAQGIPITLML